MTSCAQRKLLIIIPGSRANLPGFFKKLFPAIYRYFGLEYGYDEWMGDFKIYLGGKLPLTIEVFDWSRGITKTFSRNPATRRLKKIITERLDSYGEIIIWGKSAGGLIAEKAISDFDHARFHLVYVATPHRKRSRALANLKSAINIYSVADRFQKLGILFFYGGFGSREIKNAKNLNISISNHADFNRDTSFFCNGRQIKLFRFYLDILSKIIGREEK
jgi:hypothetical protein